MSKRDYYEILGVDRRASEADIKRAYRELAMRHHPDRNPGDAEAESRFKEAAEAYEVLSDARRRRSYDRFGHEGMSGGHGMGSGFASVEDIFGQFGDVFEDFFGFSKDDTKPRKGADVQLSLSIDFEDAIFGATTSLEIERSLECDACEGTGAAPDSAVTTCPSCAGDGQVTIGQGLFKLSQTCTRCEGVGSLVERPCGACDGAGELDASRSVSIRVPAGVGEGTKLRVPSEGLPGRHGGPSGDAMVTLEIRPHEHFTRDGLDLHHDAELSFIQAALGCTLSVPTLDAHAPLRVPPGTQHGDVIALEGLGVRHHKGSRVGKLVVRLISTTPTELDDTQRELLRALAAHSGLDVD